MIKINHKIALYPLAYTDAVLFALIGRHIIDDWLNDKWNLSDLAEHAAAAFFGTVFSFGVGYLLVAPACVRGTYRALHNSEDTYMDILPNVKTPIEIINTISKRMGI